MSFYLSKIRFLLQTVFAVVAPLLLLYCGSAYPPSNRFPKRAFNCQRCLPGEKCLPYGFRGEYKTCGIECGTERPNTRCPQGFFCFSSAGEGDPTACVPIESFIHYRTDWGRPLCVLTDDGYIFWTYGVLDRFSSTKKQKWKIAEGCTTDIDESYTTVCAPGTEPAPVVNLVRCEPITTKILREVIQNTEKEENEPESVPSAEDAGGR